MRPVLLAIAFFCCIAATAQFKNDNVLYHTVYPQDLCRELKSKKDFLLLDVRSPGEYADTSSSTGLNLGHLQGAVNIDIRQLGSRLNEIATYRNKPVYVYCSHSQRSRRVSKMLADSGFTQVNNINGGMTAFYMLDEKQGACLKSMITSRNKYGVVSPEDLCHLLSKPDRIYLLDVRTDSAWNHISLNPKFNFYGSFRGTHHISLATLGEHLNELPRNRQIIITDVSGADASTAAKLLTDQGFSQVSFLLEGFDRYFQWDQKNDQCVKQHYIPAKTYSIINATSFAGYLPENDQTLLLDVRPAEDFSNKSDLSYKNIGHLKNAVNIPLKILESNLHDIESYKNSPVIIYEFAGGPDSYAAAEILTKNGFKNVRVLSAGLFGVRWTASNVAGFSKMQSWVIDVPQQNQ